MKTNRDGPFAPHAGGQASPVRSIRYSLVAVRVLLPVFQLILRPMIAF
jgi:hypothetical protein